MKIPIKRERYQHGSLTIEKRKTGPDVWVYRWRENGPGGTRIKRKNIIGSTADFRTQAAAQKAVDGLRLEINSENTGTRQRNLTVGELISHYEITELPRKSPSTQAVYAQFIRSYLRPEWGRRPLRDVRARTVETWLESLPYAPGTRTKIKNILSALFQHAIRQEWIENNPIRAVRTSAKRLKEPDVLTAGEIAFLLPGLPEPCRMAVFLAILTGLRVSEVFGLQWQDVDWTQALLHLRRSIVNQAISALKTEGSRRPLPIPVELVNALGGVAGANHLPSKRGLDICKPCYEW